MKNVLIFSCLVAVVLVSMCWGQCPNGAPPLPGVYCGRGGVRCPRYYYCEIEQGDRWAVCCRK